MDTIKVVTYNRSSIDRVQHLLLSNLQLITVPVRKITKLASQKYTQNEH